MCWTITWCCRSARLAWSVLLPGDRSTAHFLSLSHQPARHPHSQRWREPKPSPSATRGCCTLLRLTTESSAASWRSTPMGKCRSLLGQSASVTVRLIQTVTVSL
ncbi:hypothetical protein MHYP_G00275210, partial [Metynnis hypsauchen]